MQYVTLPRAQRRRKPHGPLVRATRVVVGEVGPLLWGLPSYWTHSCCRRGGHLHLDQAAHPPVSNFAAYVFVLTNCVRPLERGVSSVVLSVGALSRLPHAAAGHRGKMPLPNPA